MSENNFTSRKTAKNKCKSRQNFFGLAVPLLSLRENKDETSTRMTADINVSSEQNLKREIDSSTTVG